MRGNNLPSSTYRLQFGPKFRLRDALRLLDYLQGLGVGWVYASPLLKARPGSEHGYDAVDPGALNPEIGSEKDLQALSRELERRGMGLLLDLVPNHMAAAATNPWWADLLRHGRRSRYAGFFDVDWSAGRLVLPVLGAPLREVLRRGELRIEQGSAGASLRYFEHAFPLAPGTPERSRGDLVGLLRRQHYRLAFWREGLKKLNYRRFFNINDLAALRQEDPGVFRATHAYVLELSRRGLVQGLRVDHVDGLYDPLGYLRRLTRAFPGYVAVEKILCGDEALPEWPVAGTTGYEFLNRLGRIFADPAGVRLLRDRYARWTRKRASFEEILYRCKTQVMGRHFAADLRRLERELLRLAGGRHPELSSRDLRRALWELSARLPVYRAYVRDGGPGPADLRHLDRALAGAARALPSLPGPRRALAFLGAVLRRRLPRDPAARAEALGFVMRWQQATGPFMAKGLEDTAFYRYNPLTSLNEVGGDPREAERPGAVAELHRFLGERRRRWPGTLNATSTHDTKRSEDVRARLDALSELPGEWAGAFERWSLLNRAKKRSVNGRPVPLADAECYLYQALVGAWPLDERDVRAFGGRLEAFLLKSMREAKARTSWLDPDPAYEQAFLDFARAVLKDARFLRDFLPFQRRVARLGAVNSLAGLALKLAAPGVPDFYRGTETFDLSLTDPDNRRPVDFARLRDALADVRRMERRRGREAAAARLLESWPDGRIKLHMTAAGLAFRRREAALLARGAYEPVHGEGRLRAHAVAFARRLEARWALAAAPRLTARISPDAFPLGALWAGTRLSLPPGAPGRWRDVFTGRTVSAEGGRLLLEETFAVLPAALLETAE